MHRQISAWDFAASIAGCSALFQGDLLVFQQLPITNSLNKFIRRGCRYKVVAEAFKLRGLYGRNDVLLFHPAKVMFEFVGDTVQVRRIPTELPSLTGKVS